MATSRDLTPDDASALTAIYDDYAWWADRDADSVRSALSETEIAVGIEDGGDLVAAARVLTDFAYYATVFDVIVAADRREESFGEFLMAEIVEHPALQSVDGLSLLCRRGLVPFYESVGFERFEPEIEVPEGGTEEMVRMTYEQSDS